MRLLIRWLLTAAALFAIAYYIVPGIRLDNFGAALVAAFAIGIVNLLVRPIIMILTLPVNIITLGLFTLVVNALMFWLAASFVSGFFGALCVYRSRAGFCRLYCRDSAVKTSSHEKLFFQPSAKRENGLPHAQPVARGAARGVQAKFRPHQA